MLLRVSCPLLVCFLIVSEVGSFLYKSGDNQKEGLEGEDTQLFWKQKNLKYLKKKLSLERNFNKAKNVIFFIGDGMSLNTVTSARIYNGQKHNRQGEETTLFFENFPSIGLSKTYCIDAQVPDSACTGTAYWTGVKTNFGMLGLSAKVTTNDTYCRLVTNETMLQSLANWNQAAGKSTGIVTTTSVTNASPAAGYAHTPFRNHESDSNIKKDDSGQCCMDIASQLILNSPGKNLNVVLGGGQDNFLPSNGSSKKETKGKRKDNKNLIEMWKEMHANNSAHYVNNRDSLLDLDLENTDYLFGLFSKMHMPFHLKADKSLQPTFAEMVASAIAVLKKNEKGFFLFAESGRIDHGHHLTKAWYALDETAALNEAVEAAYKLTDPKETLIVVTADHGHAFTMTGYPHRGNDILSYGGMAEDDLPYLTLSYANGPNQIRPTGEPMLSDSQYFAGIPMAQETHSGEDIPVYATGPWSHLLVGNFEQTHIPTVMAYASEVGDFTNHYLKS